MSKWAKVGLLFKILNSKNNMLDIVLHPNKILRQVSAPITLEDLSNPEFKL